MGMGHLRAILAAGMFGATGWIAPLAPMPARADSLADDGVPVRGVIRALDEASLSTELAAQVAKIGFREGEAFKKGDLLLAFDCERYRAEQRSAEAVAHEMRLTVESNEELERLRAVGKHDVEIARARLDKANSESHALEARLKQCEVVAPFSGRVAELDINRFEWPQPGKSFMKITSDARLEIEIIMPSRWLNWLRDGADFTFSVDETGRSYQAKVVRIGAAVDAVSQMVKVFATFERPDSEILPGMSGAAHFQRPNG